MQVRYLSLLLCLLAPAAFSYTVETKTFTGASTGIKKGITITLPQGYDANQRYPVVYVLHGYSNNHASWTEKTDIEQEADRYGVIIVNPDGNYGSWYLNRGNDKTNHYQSYIANDVVHYIDEHYATIANRNGRAITGMSMGGFGALHVAINNQAVFGAVGAMGGGVDFRPYTTRWNLTELLGSYREHAALWDQLAIVNNLDKIAAGNSLWKKGAPTLPMAIEVGTGDFFRPVNQELHQQMLRLNIRHDYTERPGKHTWSYWKNAIGYQMKFLVTALAQARATPNGMKLLMGHP